MKTLKTSSSLNLHHHSREDISKYIRAGLEFNKKMGFDAANLDFSSSVFDADNWQSYIENALEDSKGIGLDIKLAHLPFTGGNVQKNAEFLARFHQKMIRSIDGAKLLGVDHAVLHPITLALPGAAYSRREQHEFVVSNLAPVVEYANKVGVDVVIENMRVTPHFVESHRYCQAPDELCDVADALGIGVCWDFGHANISGIRQSEGLAYVGKRLKVLHVNDNVAFEDDHLLPFMGNIDWRDAMHGLALTSFDGLLNFEVAAGRIPEEMRESFAEYILKAARVLMSYIE